MSAPLWEAWEVARCEHCGAIKGRDHRPLTRRQLEIYRWIQGEIHREGYAPPFDEIAHHFDFSSLATVHEHLANIERRGWIKRRFNEARSIECLVPDGAP